MVPALAKKLNLPSHKSQQHTITTPPTNKPITPHHNILPTLPPAQQYTGSKFPTQLPQTVARQQTILSQLSILREVYKSISLLHHHYIIFISGYSFAEEIIGQ